MVYYSSCRQFEVCQARCYLLLEYGYMANGKLYQSNIDSPQGQILVEIVEKVKQNLGECSSLANYNYYKVSCKTSHKKDT